MMRNLTRALFVAAVLGSTAMAGCASTADQQSAGAVRNRPQPVSNQPAKSSTTVS